MALQPIYFDVLYKDAKSYKAKPGKQDEFGELVDELFSHYRAAQQGFFNNNPNQIRNHLLDGAQSALTNLKGLLANPKDERAT